MYVYRLENQRYALNNRGSTRAALVLRNIDPGVSRDGRGFRMERFAIVLEALVQNAGEEDGCRGAEELQCCVCHPAIEQNLLADARMELKI